MIHFSSAQKPLRLISTDSFHAEAQLLPVLALPFLAGLIAGTMVGLFSDAPQGFLLSTGLISPDPSSMTFVHLLWHAFRYVLIALLLSTGILGVALLPLLSAVRAFAFSCSVSVVLQQRTSAAFLLAFFSLGIPAVLSLPGFFLAETDAFRISRQFCQRVRRVDFSYTPALRHFLMTVLFCVSEMLYLRLLLPALLRVIA